MEEEDITDETQDWRFISYNDKHSFPKRGEKDFEPDGTKLQSTVLQESRNAMYEALSGDRKHSSKNHIRATWFQELRMARVDVLRSAHFATMGKADSAGTVWLLPEEVIYLVERGSMECWYPKGVPMSLQAVYAACIEHPGDLERLHVYTYLKKIGFIVQRAGVDLSAFNTQKVDWANEQSYLQLGLGLAKRIFSRRPPPFRSFESVFQSMEIIPYRKPPHNPIELTPNDDESLHKIDFLVWKPNTNFKKTNPSPPDYYISVIDARTHPMPDINAVDKLFNSVPVNVDNATRTQTQRLKEGWRNVILAVVDSGLISLFKLGDVGFGEEKVYTKPAPPKRRKNK
ncbi:hypothetical protein TRICI_003435 [Trichomonascus ciferrii]|uniref:tRNA-splicing endonuclease subunit Sen54 N-terminal domain-containing protein n=1 Tax=Trichomonascus ciferrii TaxID=44093 RepID=A0A642V3S4_9ASCO|nr:hypothetical protein TRICI_003435 [Trichomonascus ciferrii]